MLRAKSEQRAQEDGRIIQKLLHLLRHVARVHRSETLLRFDSHGRYNSSMIIQEIQRLRSAKPFEPFRVLTADGEGYDVRHPEYISQTPSGRLITIGLDDDSTVTLDLLLVTGIRKPMRRAKRR